MLIMKLPQLNNLKPDEVSTFKKLIEEVAECNNAIRFLDEWELLHNSNMLLLGDAEIKSIRKVYKDLLNDVLTEIVDVAQTCASQLFVFEKNADISGIIFKYRQLENLSVKDFTFYTEAGAKYIKFHPQKFNPKSFNSLKSLINDIIKFVGDIAQLGKFSGLNGETPVCDNAKIFENYIFNLLKIMQCCFTLLYLMKTKYNLNISNLFNNHIKKLQKKGYLSL